MQKYCPCGRFASLGSGIGFYERQIIEAAKVDSFDLFELCPANLHRSHDQLDGPASSCGCVEMSTVTGPLTLT
ncbi:MAG: hypothetical protein ACRDSH_11405 [Pseudonocardiaceae bacterium]